MFISDNLLSHNNE